MSTRMFGARIERNVDPKLLRGEGAFVDDIPLPGALHVAFLRSPHARARINSIETAAAKAISGVVAIYTCDDIGALDVEMPLLIPHPSMTNPQTQRPLARGDVHYVGQTIAMVVAVDRYIAEDAAALIEVGYAPLQVEMDIVKALGDGAPRVHAFIPNNLAAHFVQTSGDPDGAFAAAEHVTKITVQVDRSTAAPMECRAVAARWEAVTGELTVWDGTQAPISVRGGLASVFGIDEDKVRVIAPDVGGGFGQKVLLFYPDELLVPMAAMQLGRPVKYIEDRRENFIGSSQERTQIHTIELAALKSGEVIGLRDFFLHDTGAFIPYGIAVAQVASTSIAGPYRIPNIFVEFKAVYTPTVQVTPYRGCGRPQACFALERAMDQLAQELGLDRFEIRRRNLIADNQFPYAREGLLFADGLKVTLDSGQYGKALAMAASELGAEDFAVAQAKALSEGRYLGLGLACYVEGTGLGPYEGGHVKIHPITGKVYVNTGLSTQGQGHDTVFAQIVADQLGVAPQDVIVVEGDTKAFDWGVATFASRAAVVSGNAIHKTAATVRKKVLQAAGNMLDVDIDSIELRDSAAWVKGFNRFVPLAAIATASNPLRYAFNKAAQAATQFAPASKHDGPPLAEGEAPGLEATDYYSPAQSTWAYGVHGAIVEVDPGLCTVKIKKYVCIHDCGNMINPMLVEGQVMGGIAQGIGGALYEHLDYQPDGNLANASLMDFLVPYATEIPDVSILHLETPSPLNPLGVKGVGEAGCIAVGAVIASGVEDALRPFGALRFHQVPLSPTMIANVLERAGH
ncbi:MULTISPECIES: aerobic carbon-monoxide dehydrogenase large subunit [unclassified Bradyrhizobium]|uniref:aerobic carbon-monoxide dehydrogenase large subunit n=1 Tax=unclassified Bradyrhizobium TaxID=2631580 RepID=UPI001FFB6B4B|nr:MULTISPECIES: aerobic carbon-monoxide dehydrogenase large subunit [unclassified Bradyrhizobium]MCK1713398.1 xanthine dehydrogenase family protein molybdopterin-binding subunit [Bradyrhizobium sp. 143]MCK1730443.1 xanthine dehydrogenase family protein molybdopterin-binding subunit [Bradyrhizobium sp. 142]